MIWLLGSFIFSIFLGTTPVDVMAGVVSIFALYNIWSRRVQGHRRWWAIYWNHFDWIFAVWVLTVIAGLTIHYSFDLTGMQKVLDFRWIPLFYLLTFAVVRSRISDEAIPWVAGFSVIAGLYSIVIGIWGFDPIVDKELVAIGASGLHSNGGLFSDPVMLAQCFGLMIFWFIGPAYYYARFRERKIWLLIPAIFMMIAALFLSQNVWICFSSIIAVAIISLCFNFRVGLLILFIIGIIFGAVVAIFPNFILSAFSSSDFIHLIDNLGAMKSELALIADHPLVGFGYGYGQGAQAQNQYLLFFSSTGIIGGLCYLAILTLFVRLTIRTWLEIPDKDLFQKGLALGLIGSQIVFILSGFESTIFENWIPKYIIITVWALVVWLAYEYRVLRERI